jgi:hypothetical protein
MIKASHITSSTSDQMTKRRTLYGYVGIGIIILSIIGYMLGRPSKWGGVGKLSFVVRNAESSDVIVVDPEFREMTKIVVPNDTEVEVARGLGKWRLGSVWKLGFDEGYSGQLLAESMTYGMGFPVYHWTDSQGEALISGSFITSLPAITGLYHSSFSLSEKIRLAWFFGTNRDIKLTTIDIRQTTYIRQEKLLDGDNGYVVTRYLPQFTKVLFSETGSEGGFITVAIDDSSTEGSVSSSIARALEVLGGKVISLKNTQSDDTSSEADCKIIYTSSAIYSRVGRYMSMCTNELVSSDENKEGRVDIEVQLR